MKERSYDERRGFQRLRANFPIRCLDLNGGKVVRTRLYDISALGVGILSKDKLEESSLLRIWLHFPDRKKPLATQARLVWARKEASGDWRMGLRLKKPEILGISRLFRV